MRRLSLSTQPGPLRVLALGAHCDDIEIGCGGTLLRLAAERPDLEVTWIVFCSTPDRMTEARASAAAFLTPRNTAPRGRVRLRFPVEASHSPKAVSVTCQKVFGGCSAWSSNPR